MSSSSSIRIEKGIAAKRIRSIWRATENIQIEKEEAGVSINAKMSNRKQKHQSENNVGPPFVERNLRMMIQISADYEGKRAERKPYQLASTIDIHSHSGSSMKNSI